MNLQRVQQKLILLGLIIVPFISLGELIALFAGRLSSQSSNLTGIFKFSKDLIFVSLILIGLVDYLIRDRLNRKILIYLGLVILLVVPSILFSFGNEIIYLAAGLRWLIPLLLPIFIYRILDEKFLKKFFLYVYYLLILHLFIQILQLFFAGSWYGVSSYGLNLRNPGLFLIPNTGAFFTISALYVCLYLADFSIQRKRLVIIISMLSVFLTLSGTGLIVFITILGFYFFNRSQLKWYILIFPFGLMFIYLFVMFLNTRDANYISESGGTRLTIFVENFMESSLISTDFGYGTNSAVLLGKGEIMDSTFASLVVNLGYFGFFMILALIFIAILYAGITKDKMLFVFLIVFTLFSFTTIISEVYPVNLIFGVLMVYFLQKDGDLIYLRERA